MAHRRTDSFPEWLDAGRIDEHIPEAHSRLAQRPAARGLRESAVAEGAAVRLSAEIVDLTSVETVEAFVQRVLPEAYRLAAFMVCDPAWSEEVAHDAVLAAWDRRDRLRDPDALDAWLGRFVADRCRGLLRSRSRHGMAELGAPSYRGRADAPVPANLPARTVATLRARQERGEGRQRLWGRLSEIVPGALFVLAVGAVALVTLPWSRPSPTGPGEPTAPILDPSPSGAIPVTVMNLGAPEVAVDINDYQIQDSLGCGSIRTYEVESAAARIDLRATTGSAASVDASKPIWLVMFPTGWIAYETEPRPEQTISMCGTALFGGADPNGRVSWDLETPIASGDALMNLEVLTATQLWLGQFRHAVAATPGDSVVVTCTWSVSPAVPLRQARARLVPLEFRFLVADAEDRTVFRYVNIDLSDGHAMGIDELFTSPATGLAALSTESLKLLPVGLAGALKTAPKAANFAAWNPYADGLHIELQYANPWPAGNGPGTGVPVTIPWSAVDGLIKPDSPVRDWWTP